MDADLHLHSTASDGLVSPADLAAALAARGVGAGALTDHDTCNGFPAFAAAAAEVGLYALCGAEIAAEQDGQEVHLLSYFLDVPGGPYQDMLQRLSQARLGRAEEMLRRLRKLGITLDEQEVLAAAQPGRPHVARAMVRAGHAADVRDAFGRYLSPGRPGYVSRWRPAAGDVIAFAHAARGITTLAHPCRYRTVPLQALVLAGIDAVEAVHPSCAEAQTAALHAAAVAAGLLITGGSDFHGKADDQPLGTYVLAGDEFDRLRARLGA